MNILITGGAGYIGSHFIKLLKGQGHRLFIWDNLSTGHKEAILEGELIAKDLNDTESLESFFQKEKIDFIVHFAAKIVVPESIQFPEMYFKNNTENTKRLIDLAIKYKIKKFIFSSTAAVYGEPDTGICSEENLTKPINPYGESKLRSENYLREKPELSYVILRYFNVAGSDFESQIGHSFPEATHLIKVAAEAAVGKRSEVNIFGTDYNTPDGTCVRDYIHVMDLATAHIKAMDYLKNGGESITLNCGYGHGYSVKEVLSEVLKIAPHKFKVIETQRRLGDPAVVMAHAQKIKDILHWQPQFDSLSKIVKSAIDWELKKRF